MGRQEEIIKERLKKIEELKKKGINPYPYSFEKKENAAELQEKHKSLKNEAKAKGATTFAGRLMTFRDMGKIAFGVVQDFSGSIQVVLQEGETSDELISFFKKYIDAGDFVGVEGSVFRTKRGELSILVKKAEILSKSILPLPDKWHGLEDKEERYRKRYVDLIINPEVKEVFLKRFKMISLIRNFLNKKGFVEVETPIVQPLYGGTNAKPFETHLNALDMHAYLRVAPELYLKRLVVGGFEKVYEIGRNFRNEGIDQMHNPEFTMLEWYEAYADYNKMMDTAENLFKYLIKEVNASPVLEFRGHKINCGGKWPRLTMAEAVRKYAKIDVEESSAEDLRKFVDKNNIEYRGESNKGVLTNAIFEKMVTENLIGPIWIIDYPKEISPLAKPHRSKEGLVERFECYMGGKEICDGWSEIIDPTDQRQRFEKEQAAMRAGNDEAHPMDEDFINALEQGMPVLGGIGIGMDRLAMVLTNADSLRDVILFPFMKPIKNDNKEVVNCEENSKQEFSPKSKLPLTREEAWNLVKKYNVDKSDLNHYLESEAVMRAVANRLREDPNYYGMLGLIHDIDWGITKENSIDHLTKAPEILKKAGFDEEFISIIISHGYGFDCAGLKDKKRTRKVEYALAASETVTGLVHSYALMRKTITGMDSAGLMKKFKDKKFAAAIHREIIKECEQLGLSLEEFFKIAIEAIQGISEEVGLN
ncbi:MAG: lysine--tRNA ligase [Nanoarchaeota archaeon]|nr:lysine--tRNA ligase [Nanoarchaeota archaeon]